MCVTITVVIRGVFIFIDKEVLTYSAFLKKRQVPWLVRFQMIALKMFVQPRYVVTTPSVARVMGQATVHLGLENRTRTFVRPRTIITHRALHDKARFFGRPPSL
jgi:hypothetical protein